MMHDAQEGIVLVWVAILVVAVPAFAALVLGLGLQLLFQLLSIEDHLECENKKRALYSVDT